MFPDGLESAYLLHHMASIIGNSVCLSFPTGAAYVALNGSMAEFGSVFLNVKELIPCTTTKVIYFIMMAFSNLSCTYFSYQICFNLGVPEPWRGVYLFLAILILLIRWGGYAIYIAELFSSNKSSVETEGE